MVHHGAPEDGQGVGLHGLLLLRNHRSLLRGGGAGGKKGGQSQKEEDLASGNETMHDGRSPF
jgi:hypothetical protein